MTENKRFTNNGIEILQYGKVWAVANCPHHAEVIAEALNILIKENDKLKSKLEYAEKVLNNIGYDLVYDETENRWVIE